jgi:hypothetical protein
MSRPNRRPSALDRLNVFIGRLTEGETVPTPEAPSVRISASDVYHDAPIVSCDHLFRGRWHFYVLIRELSGLGVASCAAGVCVTVGGERVGGNAV